MTGAVDAQLAFTLPIRICGNGNTFIEVMGTIDTGFSAYVTLPTKFITLLDLPHQADIEAQMGDGRIVVLRVFRARALWHGEECPVLVYETDVTPLIGRTLLKGSLLSVEVVSGGHVSIEPMA